MAWKASWAHRTGENEKRDTDKIKKKSVRTSSACGVTKVPLKNYVNNQEKRGSNDSSVGRASDS